jgi:hypothetical protein
MVSQMTPSLSEVVPAGCLYLPNCREEEFSETHAPLGFLGASPFRGLFENSRYGSCALPLRRSKVGLRAGKTITPLLKVQPSFAGVF